jgi:predicted DNA-binding transcriptional regulator YafY
MSEALDRTKRSLDLIPYILEHQGISLDELAHRFNVSTDVLYEDLNLLFCCGLPGYTPLELIDITFDDGVVSVSEPQALDVPRKLSKEELLRLHLGLELCSRFAPKKLEVRISQLQKEISSLMSSSPIEIIYEDVADKVKTVLEAINSKVSLCFEYASAKSDSLTEREILPHAIMENMGQIYVEGFEFLSESVKSFRFDRISQMRIGRNAVEPSRSMRAEPIGGAIKLKIHHSSQNFLSENSAIILESHAREYGYEVELREISESWLISEVFANGGGVEVVEPISLRRHISQLAKSRLANL